MNIEESVEEVDRVIDQLTDKNKTVPIIVEGKKDTKTLRKLGLNGIIIELNKGLSLSDFCDSIVEKYVKVIILTDWDRRGGTLCHRMMDLFKGRIEVNTEYREQLSKFSMIKTVEGLYSWINTMKNQ